jgi:hypothetical protein
MEQVNCRTSPYVKPGGGTGYMHLVKACVGKI